tara:strand:- start:213 stop:755 length:543 start_codon:yes stop_codon:yes gene_type:complete
MTNYSRSFAMPNKETFEMLPVKEFIYRHIQPGDVIVDPYARSSKVGTITNDLNPDFNTDFNLEASEFLAQMVANGSLADVVLFDPPYSPRQVKECYDSCGLKLHQETTQSSVYSSAKKLIRQILKPKGIVLTFCWNTGLIHKDYEFKEIHLVSHGGWHNDTICTAQVSPVYLWEDESNKS